MADPRWRTTISNFKFYHFLLLFLAVQVFSCYYFIRKDNKKDDFTNIIDILRISVEK